MKEPVTMKFENLVFKNGENLTIRMPDPKWKRGYAIITDVDGEPKGFIKINHVQNQPFNSIPARVFRREHDPHLQDESSVAMALEKFHPEFDLKSTVTLIYFELVSDEEYKQYGGIL